MRALLDAAAKAALRMTGRGGFEDGRRAYADGWENGYKDGLHDGLHAEDFEPADK
jgi:hypothetical protein